MSFIVRTDDLPIFEDSSGGLRIEGSRVLLETVIRAFQDGATPEAIVQRYPTVNLENAYTVIAYYLRHRREVDEYLARREQSAQQVRERIERHQRDMREIRSRLLAQATV
ncbi:MAG: DUF433 domain-containing protein [Chloroflexi bacterium]|nr:DUF433 domain-containing protein [Chloroflexota bacterium]